MAQAISCASRNAFSSSSDASNATVEAGGGAAANVEVVDEPKNRLPPRDALLVWFGLLLLLLLLKIIDSDAFKGTNAADAAFRDASSDCCVVVLVLLMERPPPSRLVVDEVSALVFRPAPAPSLRVELANVVTVLRRLVVVEVLLVVVVVVVAGIPFGLAGVEADEDVAVGRDARDVFFCCFCCDMLSCVFGCFLLFSKNFVR